MDYEAFLSQFTDYRPITDYWRRFSIADMQGEAEILALYEQVFSECKTNYKYLTELVMVLNHRMWLYHHTHGNKRLIELYSSLWERADQYACTYLKDEELSYFYRVTD